jgi:beta-phosphoglucomutase-like phosphatase (HAD superfamily)
VANGKPAPDLFLHAAAQSGADPARCVVVEDSEAGVQGAIAAGMRVLGYAGGLTSRERLSGAGAEVFDRMDELPTLILGY